MQKSTYLIPLILLSILAVCGIATYIVLTLQGDSSNADAKTTLATTETQQFTDLAGEPFSFSEFEGKVRVVNSWASWTPFSVQELKDLETLAKEYADDSVVFIAVNRKESKEVAQAFLSTLGTFEALHIAIDVHDTYYASVGGYAMPETTFYDAKGNIVFHKRGSMTQDEMKTRIREAQASQK